MTLMAKQRIGLLGGSFNPAHEGHIHLSLFAMKRLRLNKVWWLVSPQNPLKSKDQMADYHTRFEFAANLTAPHPSIELSDIEATYDLHYSVDTIATLLQMYPHTDFVWIMGADNLANFHRWRQWEDIANALPIAIFDRAPYQLSALNSKMAKRFSKHRIDERDASILPRVCAPAWTYCTIPRHPQSATNLRKKLGKNAFLGHTENVS